MTGLAQSWGPAAWYLFHMISLTWEEKYIKKYEEFFRLIKETIPCYTCSTNFKKKLNYKGYSIKDNCSSKTRMIEWLINIHNMVNKSNKKKRYTINEVLQIYIKNNLLILNSNMTKIFIREYIYYNIRYYKKNQSIKLLYFLAYIYPDPKKREHLTYFVNNHKSRSISQFLNGYSRNL
jgi:hypothetical protein